MNTFDRMTVKLPEGEFEGMRVEKFTVGENDLSNFRLAIREGRGTRPGKYTRLVCDGKIWMSDTDAEKSDHYEAVRAIQVEKAERVLVNGLGLGMVVAAALSFDHVKHIDVVEKDDRVIALVAPTYQRDSRVHVHHADAYEQAKKWKQGTRWDVGWSDIWPDIRTDNLPDMGRLNRSYGRRCTWHGCWSQRMLLGIARRDKLEEKRLA